MLFSRSVFCFVDEQSLVYYSNPNMTTHDDLLTDETE